MAALAYFELKSDAIRQRVQSYLWACPDGVVVKFQTQAKSREQEEHYHALIGEIAEKELLHGKKLSAEVWKRLLIAAFKYDTLQMPELADEWDKFGSTTLYPMLGNRTGYVMVGEQSREFSKKLAAAFITWLQEFQDSEAEQ